MYKSGENFKLLRFRELIFPLIFFFIFFTSVHSTNQKLTSEIIINGNVKIKKSSILNKLKLKENKPFYSSLFYNDIDNLRTYYKNKGFPSAKIKGVYENQPEGVIVKIFITEGKQIKIENINIDDKKYEKKYNEIKNEFLKNPWDKNTKDIIESKIKTFLQEKGYFKSEISIKADISNKYFMNLNININKGNIYYFGNLYILGVKEIKRSDLKKRKTFDKGERFSTLKIKDYQKDLYNLNVFKNVNIKYFPRDNNIIDILLDVTEDKFKWVGLQLGYTTPSLTKFGIEWGNNNIFNELNRIKISNENIINFNTSEYEVKVNFNYRDRWFFLKKLVFDNNIEIKNEKHENYTNKQITASSDFIKEFYQDSFFKLGYEKKLIYYDNIEDIEYIEDEKKWLISNSLIFNIYYDNIEKKMNPTKDSLFVNINFKYNGSILKGDWQYFYRNYEFSLYKNIYKKKYISLFHFDYKTYTSLNNKIKVPFDDLFSLGGVYNIRGYDYKEIGEKFYKIYYFNKSERFKIYKKFWIELFLDGGKGFNKYEKIDMKSLNISTGSEIRYVLPFLVIRAGYGFQLIDDNELFYLSIGNIF